MGSSRAAGTASHPTAVGLPISDALQDQVLSLPMSPVHTVGEIDEVSDVLAGIVEKMREPDPVRG